MTQREPPVLLRLAGVTKDYPRITTGRDRLRTLLALLFRREEGPHFRAVDGVDFELRRGESLGIVGENGAGKSTLLKMIAGIMRPTHGTVSAHGSIGALLELGSGFHPDYTGRENIYLAGALMGLSRTEMRGREEAITAFADIGPFIDEPLRHYSSGMVVRLGFAVVSTLRPDILITDEVLAVGDESFQKKCIEWLETYLDGGGTLLLVSHSMFHVQTLCRKALWLHHGRPRLYGGAFDVTREYLAYHEEKRKAGRETWRATGNSARILDAWTESDDGTPATTFRMGEALVVQGVAFEPSDRPPVLLFGILRADGTAVYGSHSNERGGYLPARIDANRFAFSVRFDELNLLPGKYSLWTHTLDPEGLRLFDTFEVEFVVTGETRDYGLVQLRHAWGAGRGGRAVR